MEKLKNHMEALRQELNQLMGEFDTCDKEKLLKVSRELDEVICKYIRMEKSSENIKDTH